MKRLIARFYFFVAILFLLSLFVGSSFADYVNGNNSVETFNSTYISGNGKFINGKGSLGYGTFEDPGFSYVRYFYNGQDGATGVVDSGYVETVREFYNGLGSGSSVGIVNGGDFYIGRDFVNAKDNGNTGIINGGTFTILRNFLNGDNSNTTSEINGGTITLNGIFYNGYAGINSTSLISGGTITLNTGDFYTGYGLGTDATVSGGIVDILNGDFENGLVGGGSGLVSGGTINT